MSVECLNVRFVVLEEQSSKGRSESLKWREYERAHPPSRAGMGWGVSAGVAKYGRRPSSLFQEDVCTALVFVSAS